MRSEQSQKMYIVTVDMGYGHQRAVHPLRHLASPPPGIETTNGNIVTANNYPGIPASDERRWSGGQGLYELISRLKNVPVIGTNAFKVMDYLQRIGPFYPKKDLSKPTLQLKEQYKWIKEGWGKDLIDRLNQDPQPMVTSFFTVAFFAEEHGYKGDIYCLCTDTDISRTWAPLHAERTRIKYLAPNRRVKERLMLYGVPEGSITVTGFPLPTENIGRNLDILKASLACRIQHLDPTNRYQKKYEHTIQYNLGNATCDEANPHPLTITFAVGGAGAQRDIGIAILDSLHDTIASGEVHLNLVAGVRRDVYDYFEKELKRWHMKHGESESVRIIFAETKQAYFEKFDEALKTTDILWTKPSELSFYAGLGLPIIIAPPVGSQEMYNKAWLHQIGAGFEQEDPRYTHEWLFDWISSGWLAEAAMRGFMDAPHNGVEHITDMVLNGKKSEIEDVHFL